MKVFIPHWSFSFASTEIYANSLAEAKEIALQELKQDKPDSTIHDVDTYVEEWESCTVEENVLEWMRCLISDEPLKNVLNFFLRECEMIGYYNHHFPHYDGKESLFDYYCRCAQIIEKDPVYCQKRNAFYYK